MKKEKGFVTRYKIKMDRNLQLTKLPSILPDDTQLLLNTLKVLYRYAKDKRDYQPLSKILREFNIYSYRVDDDNIVFLPVLPINVLAIYFVYGNLNNLEKKEKIPQLLTIVGDRYAGKTVTSFVLALIAMKMLNCKLYIYGDVDYLGELLSRVDSRIIWCRPDRYDLPPIDGKPKIILYNELGEPLYSKTSMKGESIETDFFSFRARHYDAWIIYNAVYYPGFQSSKKGSSYIDLFKWLSIKSINIIEKSLPPGYDSLLSITNYFSRDEGLVIGSFPGEGTTAFLVKTKPPKWLIKAHKIARMRRHLEALMLRSQKDKAIMELIAEMKEKGMTNKDIQLAIKEKFGVNISVRTIQRRYRAWRMMKGLEQ